MFGCQIGGGFFNSRLYKLKFLVKNYTTSFLQKFRLNIKTEDVLMIHHLTPCPEHSHCAVTAGAAPTQQNCIQAPDRCPTGEKYLDTKKIFAESVN